MKEILTLLLFVTIIVAKLSIVILSIPVFINLILLIFPKINIAIGTKRDGTKLKFKVIDGEIDCSFKSLVKLDVSNCKDLKVLDCHYNRLASLDLSKNTELKHLNCNDNELTSLDVSKNTKLIELNCHYNQLTSLDLSKNTELEKLRCQPELCKHDYIEGLFVTQELKNKTVGGYKIINKFKTIKI